MANRERGEVLVVVEGKTYTLRPTINAICDVEDLLGQPFTQLSDRAATGDIRAMRALLWAYLQDRHSDEIKTVQDAGHWVERAGGLPGLETALRDIATLNSPPAATETARPPEAHPSSPGGVSTLRRVGSG